MTNYFKTQPYALLKIMYIIFQQIQNSRFQILVV